MRARRTTRARVATLAAAATLAAVAALAACPGASALPRGLSALPTKEQVTEAFAADGWVLDPGVAQPTVFNGTARAFLAAASNASTLSTGEPKLAVYLEGDGYAMGRLTAEVLGPAARRMVVDYVDSFVAYLIAPRWVARYGNETWFRDAEALVAHFLILSSSEGFEALLDQGGFFPQPLVDEMRGVADGLNATYGPVGSFSYWQRVVTLNWGIDWLSAHAFAGKFQLGRALRRSAALVGADPRAVAAALDGDEPFLRAPIHCDAFGRANPDGGGVLMARAFQLPTCDVFQEAAATFVYNPTDGRRPAAALSAPGLVGSITAVGAGGVAMGVDTLRSAYSNLTAVGFNSVLLVRHVAHTAGSLDEALGVIGAARRGCPWLYPVCDTASCAMVEAGAHDPTPPAQLDPLRFVESKALRAALPTAAWLHNNTGSAAVWRNGTYARAQSYAYPAGVGDYNRGLFSLALQPYNASAFGPAGSYVFGTWEDDKKQTRSLLNDYFPPSRVRPTDDFVVVSNIAIVPEMRLSQMAPASDLLTLTEESAQWRYDRLADELAAVRGETLGPDDAKEVITFLSPDRTPGYWNNTLVPGEPMTAQIEGAISVIDLRSADAIVLHSKTGYWTDNWVQVSLNKYVVV